MGLLEIAYDIHGFVEPFNLLGAILGALYAQTGDLLATTASLQLCASIRLTQNIPILYRYTRLLQKLHDARAKRTSVEFEQLIGFQKITSAHRLNNQYATLAPNFRNICTASVW